MVTQLGVSCYSGFLNYCGRAVISQLKCPKAKQHQVTTSAGELRVAAKTLTSRVQILFSDFKRISYKRIGLSKLREKEKDSKGIHTRLCMWTPAQRTNRHKGIRQQQTLFFMLYFGQCQILKRENRRRDKM